MTAESPTEQIAELCASYHYEQLPDDVTVIARMCILDNVGCAIRGAREPVAKIIGRELFNRETDERDLVPGALTSGRAPDRAMLHGVAAHAIDYDDTFIPGKSAHAGSAVVGTALAMLPDLEVSGTELITAVVAGYETAARVGALLHDDHYLKGFHPTSTVGVFAAAATAARLLKLDTGQVCATLGLAATQASGLKCTFGTMAKPFNAGNAAAGGTLAGKLVAGGFTAPADALEASKGYLDMYMGVNEPEWCVEDKGACRIRENLFKFHAACHATHPVIEGLRILRAERPFADEELHSMTLRVSELSLKTASILTPRSGLESKFSFNQVAACTLAGMNMAADETYSDEVVNNPGVSALRSRISVEANPQLVPAQVGISVTLASGQVLDFDFDAGEHFSTDLVSQLPALENKFLGNVSAALGEATAIQLLAAIAGLPNAARALESLSCCP